MITRMTGPVAAGLLFGLLGLSTTAHAASFETFDLAWSGASFGNSARATGTITVTGLPNPTSGETNIYSAIDSLSVTVTGAGSGDGTWTKADLPTSGLPVVWWTGGKTLDLGTELVGQPTDGGSWGTPDGASGDFNLFFDTPGAPFGVFYFTMVTDQEKGDPMLLTEFAPASSVPEPASLAVFAAGLAGLGCFARRRG